MIHVRSQLSMQIPSFQSSPKHQTSLKRESVKIPKTKIPKTKVPKSQNPEKTKSRKNYANFDLPLFLLG
jgi:hypothetical protein